MPILVYFKNPQMSLLLSGKIDKEYVRKLRKAFGNVLEMQNPDGQAVVIIGHADCEISYIAEITQETMDDMMKKQATDAARKVGSQIQTHRNLPGGKGGFRKRH